MSDLKDFDTLALAQAHPITTYNKITAGQAMQYFGLTGVLDLLEANIANTTVITISPAVDATESDPAIAAVTTSVGALCRTILSSAAGTGFACDPNAEDGYTNRGAAQLLLAEGVFPSQAIVDGFWAKGTSIIYPHINATEHEFQLAKNTVTLKSVTHTNGYAVINILSDCELHNPRLIATNPRTNRLQRISSFYGVSATGKYECLVPQQWRNADLFVDDVYSVIE